MATPIERSPSVPADILGCQAIAPEVGITRTPVIDPNACQSGVALGLSCSVTTNTTLWTSFPNVQSPHVQRLTVHLAVDWIAKELAEPARPETRRRQNGLA
jgi:hypothetical protein